MITNLVSVSPSTQEIAMQTPAKIKTVSPNGYSDDYGPNVADILARGTRVIIGRVPQQVRKELAAAVKDGVLGHLAKDGLKPEIYFHPSHRNGAIERQAREAAYSVSCIAKVIAVKPVDERVADAIASLTRSH
jgi:hypothetical protein